MAQAVGSTGIGTAGKHPWAKGVKEAVPKTAKVFEEAYHRALLDAFR